MQETIKSHLRLIVGHFELESLESKLQYLEGAFSFPKTVYSLAFVKLIKVWLSTLLFLQVRGRSVLVDLFLYQNTACNKLTSTKPFSELVARVAKANPSLRKLVGRSLHANKV